MGSQPATIELVAPVTNNRHLKMFWTTQRVYPVRVRWTFPSEFEASKVARYLEHHFKYRDQLEWTQAGHVILMTYVRDRSQQVEDVAS